MLQFRRSTCYKTFYKIFIPNRVLSIYYLANLIAQLINKNTKMLTLNMYNKIIILLAN